MCDALPTSCRVGVARDLHRRADGGVRNCSTSVFGLKFESEPPTKLVRDRTRWLLVAPCPLILDTLPSVTSAVTCNHHWCSACRRHGCMFAMPSVTTPAAIKQIWRVLPGELRPVSCTNVAAGEGVTPLALADAVVRSHFALVHSRVSESCLAASEVSGTC